MAFATSSSSSFSPPLAEAPPAPKRAKSPPLAFEKTSNDALAPLISPPHAFQHPDPFFSPSSHIMSPNGSALGGSPDLQALVHKQSAAIAQLHSAFAAEREAWSCERESLYQRISSLEKLLITASGHSPAKSPIISPNNGGAVTSPPGSRLTSGNHRLPSIAEDENMEPLSRRREGAPSSISIPLIDTVAGSSQKPRNNSVVSFADDSLKVEEIPSLSPNSLRALSPIPDEHKAHAGHTPIKTPARPRTPPPQNMTLTDIDDTPTKNNTHLNALLAQSNDSDEDPSLSGPLSMPELPNRPGEHNFTEEMLCKRLEKIAQSPGTEESRPLVFSQPSPGLATPEGLDGSPFGPSSTSSNPPAPAPTHDLPTQAHAAGSSAMSPQSGLPLSQVASNEVRDDDDDDAVQRDFDQGGIKLKKKASSNFGAPFGCLGGLGGGRRAS